MASDAPKDLISKLLVVDPKRRLTVDEALKHEFFQVMVSRERPLIETLFHRLKASRFTHAGVSVAFFGSMQSNINH